MHLLTVANIHSHLSLLFVIFSTPVSVSSCVFKSVTTTTGGRLICYASASDGRHNGAHCQVARAGYTISGGDHDRASRISAFATSHAVVPDLLRTVP